MERKKARELIISHGTNSPLKIASERKIEILYEDLGKHTWGYYTRIKRIPYIHINNRITYECVLYTSAHELGHDVLHPDVNVPFLRSNTLQLADKLERQAHRFAVYLLIGDNQPVPGETKHQFLLRCGVPEMFHTFL
ncbi:ImmA/IrrE family metallo-endopeptidase [Paenibacillus sp. TAB 01]|uniref:ImmA/IrrE family metallo-endopeptidase n=1 Tax=Paenibacillus sp. TAB 01 TaxID=3368988 RepID=UPI0037515096